MIRTIPPFLRRVIDSQGKEHPILTSLVEQAPPSHLYHYTSAAGIKGILKTKELWATEAHFLDDRSEIVYFKRLIGDCAKLLARETTIVKTEAEERFLLTLAHSVLEERRPGVCVTSFSTDDDSLSLWRQYGSATESYCIGLSGTLMKQAATHQNCMLGRCTYDEDMASNIAQEILVSLLVRYRASNYDGDEEERLHDALSDMTLQYGPFIKRTPFDVEREWRIVTGQEMSLDVHEVRGRLRPFCRFDISVPISTTDHMNTPKILSRPDGSEALPGYAIGLLSKKMLGRNIWGGVYIH